MSGRREKGEKKKGENDEWKGCDHKTRNSSIANHSVPDTIPDLIQHNTNTPYTYRQLMLSSFCAAVVCGIAR